MGVHVHQPEADARAGDTRVSGHGWKSRCDHDRVSQALSERYAPPPPWRRPVTIVVTVVVAAIALAWLGWAAFEQATPEINSTLVGYHVVDAHSVTAHVDVAVHAGATHPSCTVQALATDHSIVGELRFIPVAGSNEVTVRTERMATSVALPGCIADGQDGPR
jgi:hypothetical protein